MCQLFSNSHCPVQHKYTSQAMREQFVFEIKKKGEKEKKQETCKELQSIALKWEDRKLILKM